MAGLTPGDEGEEYTGGKRSSQLRPGCKTDAVAFQGIAEQPHQLRGRPRQAHGGRPDRWQCDRHALAGKRSRGGHGLVSGHASGVRPSASSCGAKANFGGKLPFTWGKQLSRLSDLQRQRHHDLRLLRGLSLLREEQHHPALRIRARSLLHQLRVPQAAAWVLRHEPGRRVAGRGQCGQHRGRRRRRNRHGLRFLP